jgi:hypothetical protein
MKTDENVPLTISQKLGRKTNGNFLSVLWIQIQIQGGPWIRIRIQEGKNYPEI